MTAPKGYFTIWHGKMQVNVPFDIFKLHTCELDPIKSEEFKQTVKSRYPWITDDGMNVIFNNAKKEMKRLNDERLREKGTVSMNPVTDVSGEIAKMRSRIEKNPEDAMAWMKLGELLCKSGEMEEGYKALSKGRSLLK